jgi:chromosome segregation ATPase
MFRRPDYVTHEDIQNWKLQATRKLLAPLAQAWPDILLLLAGMNEQNFDPERLGAVLAAEFTQLINRLQREHSEREWNAIRKLQEEKDKVIAQQKAQINTLQNQYQVLYKDRERLKKRVNNCESELNEQSDLITTLRTRLNSITGVVPRE